MKPKILTKAGEVDYDTFYYALNAYYPEERSKFFSGGILVTKGEDRQFYPKEEILNWRELPYHKLLTTNPK